MIIKWAVRGKDNNVGLQPPQGILTCVHMHTHAYMFSIPNLGIESC